MAPKDIIREEMKKLAIKSKPIPKHLKGDERMRWVFKMLNKQAGVKRLMKNLADR